MTSSSETILGAMRSSPTLYAEVIAGIPAVRAAILENAKQAELDAERQAKDHALAEAQLAKEKAVTDRLQEILGTGKETLSDEEVEFLRDWITDQIESNHIRQYLGFNPSPVAELEAITGRNRAAPLAIVAGNWETAIRLVYSAIQFDPPGSGDWIGAFAFICWHVLRHAKQMAGRE